MRCATMLAVAALICHGGADPARADDSAAARALGTLYRDYDKGAFDRAFAAAGRIRPAKLINADYLLFARGQSAWLIGEHRAALAAFQQLSRMKSSRFAGVARWRAADSLWSLGRTREAVRAYRKLLAAKADAGGGDRVLAKFRIAQGHARQKQTSGAIRGFRELALEHPGHMLAPIAQKRLWELGGAAASTLSAKDRIARAVRLTAAHEWREAVRELSMVGDDAPAAIRLERDYQHAMTLFKMRRDYRRAGEMLLGLYKRLDPARQPQALFHGARALSRANFDKKAIPYYLRVVREYPHSSWAIEAQYLAGWLEYNLGRYKRAIPLLRTVRSRWPKSRWAKEALWFLGFCHYLLDQHDKALAHFEKLAKKPGRWVGGKGRYWYARTLQKMKRKAKAMTAYRALVSRYPLSWYAMLARARVAEAKATVPVFGDAPRDPARAPPIAQKLDPAHRKDPAIRKADELLEAGLTVAAGVELRREEKAFLGRVDRASGVATLLDRYRRAKNFNRPWMLAIVRGGRRALDAPPTGPARVWWKHAYPRAYETLVEKYRKLGNNPPYYLYAIMRQESGYDPHVVSYANAIGLVQMIPRTTRKVVRELGIPYTEDLLWDPELNVRTGAWYIGNLLGKFKGQIPLGAGSFNSGPKPVMRWLDQHGDHPIDELVELVSYSQTREYMKRVTEHYARYLYLYEKKVYEQPLAVDRRYVANDLTY